MNRKSFGLLAGLTFAFIMALSAFAAIPAAPSPCMASSETDGQPAGMISCQALSHEDPWKASQLLSPADLAKTIADPQNPQPLIFCIGPGAVIKNSIDIGPARDSVNLLKLKQQLIKLPKDAPIVVYCGCCPFEHCPNIRPAFTLLNEMNFTRPRLLNIEHNIKTDWIIKGYPSTP